MYYTCEGIILYKVTKMAVPKRKTSPSRRNMRRAHDALSAVNIAVDAQGDYTRSHHICLKTGIYKGKQILGNKQAAQEASEATDAGTTAEPNN